jgi:hypothetical protein
MIPPFRSPESLDFTGQASDGRRWLRRGFGKSVILLMFLGMGSVKGKWIVKSKPRLSLAEPD